MTTSLNEVCIALALSGPCATAHYASPRQDLDNVFDFDLARESPEPATTASAPEYALEREVRYEDLAKVFRPFSPSPMPPSPWFDFYEEDYSNPDDYLEKVHCLSFHSS